jgi:hypothetical protein
MCGILIFVSKDRLNVFLLKQFRFLNSLNVRFYLRIVGTVAFILNFFPWLLHVFRNLWKYSLTCGTKLILKIKILHFDVEILHCIGKNLYNFLFRRSALNIFLSFSHSVLFLKPNFIQDFLSIIDIYILCLKDTFLAISFYFETCLIIYSIYIEFILESIIFKTVFTNLMLIFRAQIDVLIYWIILGF